MFIGGRQDAASFEGERFCVLDEAPEGLPPATHIPVYDDLTDRPIVANLDRVAAGIHAAREKSRPVIVFCGHGVRRSPMAAAWYLYRYEHLTLDEAYARIRAIRPGIEDARAWVGDPSPLGQDGRADPL